MNTENVSLHNGVMMRLVQNACKNDTYIVDQGDEKTEMMDKREFAKLMASYASFMANNYPQLFVSIGRYLEICNLPTSPVLIEELYGKMPFQKTEGNMENVHIRYNIKLDDICHVIIEFQNNPFAVVATMYCGDTPQERQTVDTVSTLCNFIEKYTGEKVVMDE